MEKVRFIPVAGRQSSPARNGRPTAVTDRYPFRGHRTCAEWSEPEDVK